jgi:hypothetical protein
MDHGNVETLSITDNGHQTKAGLALRFPLIAAEKQTQNSKFHPPLGTYGGLLNITS